MEGRLAVRRRTPIRHLDLTLVGATVAISAISLLMIYSATRQKQLSAGSDPAYFLKRQALFLAIGAVAMVVMMVFDYQALRELAPALFCGAVVTLILVLTPLGFESRGIQAWFQIGPFQLQPSEFTKVVLIIGLSAYCAAHRGDLTGRVLAVGLGLVMIPWLLIYRQPDLGTAMVLAAIIGAVVLVGGAQGRHLAILGGAVLLLVVVVLQTGKLDQVGRITSFLDPDAARDSGAYNQRQSQVAIAAGGFAGQGLFRGTQTNLSFVPEQHTDFIFTAVGEELGFLGSATILGLFGLMIWRTWRAAALARDEFGSLVCVGVLAMLVFQVFENVGMALGITPVAGIPLPLMSYGGSSTIATMMALGLVLNVHMRRLR